MRFRFRNPTTYSVKSKICTQLYIQGDVDDAPYLRRHVDWWDPGPRPPDRDPPPPGQISGEAGGTRRTHPLPFRGFAVRLDLKRKF